jgi:antitoxin HigA-1
MFMKNPSHPGKMIGDSFEELGISITAAAKALSVSRQQLHNVISGRSSITADMACRLEQALGSTAQTWLTMQANYDLAQIRNRPEHIKINRFVAA